ncbi:hypothetical protein [Aurantimonas marina]|uniref:hypothetical protein n=1 Tax=Aurantimonas marina TaxID=2780508 RepID=UPI0019D1EEAD|nr:hypothetical protein [Aurantimonas marina]
MTTENDTENRQQAVTSGYVMVPIEASEAMLAAAWRECSEGGKETYRSAWGAMIQEWQAAAVKDSLTAQPIAYAAFADSGNIQIWCSDPEQAETLRQNYGHDLKPLYAAPPAPDISGLELFAKRAIGICEGEAGEWDSDDVIIQKNYAQACANRIRRLRDEFLAAHKQEGAGNVSG